MHQYTLARLAGGNFRGDFGTSHWHLAVPAVVVRTSGTIKELVVRSRSWRYDQGAGGTIKGLAVRTKIVEKPLLEGLTWQHHKQLPRMESPSQSGAIEEPAVQLKQERLQWAGG
ncbi:unnamed protein product [Lampetra fluviatilis]